MLSNAYFLAKFRFDTAENEPAKNLQTFAKTNANSANFAVGGGGPGAVARAFQILDTKKQGHMSRDEMDTVRCLNHCFVNAPLSYRVSFTA